MPESCCIDPGQGDGMKTRVWLALLGAACGDGGSGPDAVTLVVASVTPVPNAADVETGATVTATFNQAVDPATVTSSSLVVRHRGNVVPARVSYDAATHTARAVVALLPDTSYQAEVTTSIRTLSGSGLTAPHSWSFVTREWQATTVDTAGTVGFQSSVERDGAGRLHVTYADSYESWNFKYATCAVSCEIGGNWQRIAVDTAGSVGQHSALAVEANGRLHTSYAHSGNEDLKYATCAANCASAASWQTVTLDGALTSVGTFTAIVVDATGRIHITYSDDTNGNLKYATCASGCATATNWQMATVDAGGMGVQATSLAVQPNGRLHVAYYDFASRDLDYATCGGNCATPGNWQSVTVDAAGDVGRDASMAVDVTGRLHVSYYEYGDGNRKYATCATNCTAAASWQSATVEAIGDVGWYSSLAVDEHGRVHVAYYYNGQDVLKYATCVTNCTDALNWRSTVVDFLYVGIEPSIFVDPNGAVHITYYDWANTNLKYIR
jgi:hypothetical protein